MKKSILLIILIVLTVSQSYGQGKHYYSIQDALTHHLEELKSNIRDYDHIFIQTKLDENIQLPVNVLKVENDLNARFLKRSDRNFLVEVRIETQMNRLQLNVTNYRIEKMSNKKVRLLNLNNGGRYEIVNTAH